MSVTETAIRHSTSIWQQTNTTSLAFLFFFILSLVCLLRLFVVASPKWNWSNSIFRDLLLWSDQYELQKKGEGEEEDLGSGNVQSPKSSKHGISRKGHRKPRVPKIKWRNWQRLLCTCAWLSLPAVCVSRRLPLAVWPSLKRWNAVISSSLCTPELTGGLIVTLRQSNLKGNGMGWAKRAAPSRDGAILTWLSQSQATPAPHPPSILVLIWPSAVDGTLKSKDPPPPPAPQSS